MQMYKDFIIAPSDLPNYKAYIDNKSPNLRPSCWDCREFSLEDLSAPLAYINTFKNKYIKRSFLDIIMRKKPELIYKTLISESADSLLRYKDKFDCEEHLKIINDYKLIFYILFYNDRYDYINCDFIVKKELTKITHFMSCNNGYKIFIKLTNLSITLRVDITKLKATISFLPKDTTLTAKEMYNMLIDEVDCIENKIKQEALYLNKAKELRDIIKEK